MIVTLKKPLLRLLILLMLGLSTATTSRASIDIDPLPRDAVDGAHPAAPPTHQALQPSVAESPSTTIDVKALTDYKHLDSAMEEAAMDREVINPAGPVRLLIAGLLLLIFSCYLYDLKSAHRFYRDFSEKNKDEGPFLRWWSRRNRIKLWTMIPSSSLLIVGLFLDSGVWQKIAGSVTPARAATVGALLALAGYLTYDFSRARQVHRNIAHDLDSAESFLAWWLNSNLTNVRALGKIFTLLLILIASGLFGGSTYGRKVVDIFTSYRLLVISTIVTLLGVGYMVWDLLRAHRIYRELNRYAEADDDPPESFLGWWFMANLTILRGVLLILIFFSVICTVAMVAASSFRHSFTTYELLMVGAILILLGYVTWDLLCARKIYGELNRDVGAEHPESFIFWWFRANLGFLEVALILILFATLSAIGMFAGPLLRNYIAALFTTDSLLVIGAILLMTGYLLYDLTSSRKYYVNDLWFSLEEVSFKQWWLQRSTVHTGVIALILFLAVGTVVMQDTLFRGESTNYLMTARGYLTKEQYREASIELRNAIKHNPRDPVAHLGLAQTLWRIGDGRDALEYARTAVWLAPNFYEAHLVHGWLALVSGEFPEALKAAQTAGTLKPAEVAPLCLLARIFTRQGAYGQAADLYRRILKTNPDDPAMRAQLVDNALARMAYDEANGEAETGLKVSPRDMNLLLLRATALRKLERSDEALMTLRSAAVVNPRSPLPHLGMGDLFTLQGEFTAAAGSYEKVLTRDPENARAMNNLANLIVDHGYDLNRAAMLALLLFKQSPHDPVVLDTLGWVLFRQGKTVMALPLLRMATLQAPSSTKLYHLGAALLATGDLKEGRSQLTKALELSPSFREASQARALLGSRGRNPESKRSCRHAAVTAATT